MMHYYMTDFGGFFAANVAPANPSNRNHRTVDELHLRARRFRSSHVRRRLVLTAQLISRRIALYKRNSTAKKELYAMKDYELAKLGISRGEIEFIVSGRPRRSFSTSFAALKQYLAKVRDNIEKATQRRAGYRELMAMSDSQLADLGISRGMIVAAVQGNLILSPSNSSSANINSKQGSLTAIADKNDLHNPPNDNKQDNDHRHAV
ncbi:DUF1127 domain-containing protein [Sneathiella marina]|uniref:DUF1127 domain-containing protein n=1 Tax=Sneathiella marina TaxID=2950108 RepID=A0ABY4VZM1_9PROT|nr:DUF1127 domain-containing protein [Sneathiella marina]USG60387.1 DUF1127 domain-containing protein [Sneathiella marina]